MEEATKIYNCPVREYCAYARQLENALAEIDSRIETSTLVKTPAKLRRRLERDALILEGASYRIDDCQASVDGAGCIIREQVNANPTLERLMHPTLVQSIAGKVLAYFGL